MAAKDNSWVLVTGASIGFGEEFGGNTQHKVGRWSLW
jgi:short-subunit dehydrogenase